MKTSMYPYATGIAIAGAGALFALAPGTAQAAPLVSPSLSPPTTQCVLMPAGCSPNSLIGPSLNYVPIPNALAAASLGSFGPYEPFHSIATSDPLYNLIGIAGLVPIVNIFVSNGVNGAPGTGANGGNAGLLVGYGGAGGSGANSR